MTNWPGDEDLLREPEIKASAHPDGLLARTEQKIRDILKADTGLEAKVEALLHIVIDERADMLRECTFEFGREQERE